tara:strand:- start:1775 stop:2902 length:1128 start_codon:yes stop_codon:yes gene_type:complete
MKKIFMFVNVDWFFFSHRLSIAEVAADKGIDMTVFTDFTRPHNEKYNGFTLKKSPIQRTLNGFHSIFIEFFHLIRLIRREQPSVIHAVTIKPIIFLGIICFILKIPFIASISGLGPAFTSTNYKGKARLFIIKIIYRIIFSPKNVSVICQSSYDAEVLLDNNLITSEKIIMIEGSGVNLEKYKPQKGLKQDVIKILMASRLLKEKGVEEFCKAASIIQKKYDFNVSFTLAGPVDSDSLGSLTENQVVELCKSSNVEFLGNRSDIKYILSNTHIFVLPSYYAEGIPKVLLEAAASGCAVITTNHPGCRNAIVPGETGILVAPKNISALVNALIYLISDEELIESMGRAGRQLAERRFCVNKVIDIHYSLYNSPKKD